MPALNKNYFSVPKDGDSITDCKYLIKLMTNEEDTGFPLLGGVNLFEEFFAPQPYLKRMSARLKMISSERCAMRALFLSAGELPSRPPRFS